MAEQDTRSLPQARNLADHIASHVQAVIYGWRHAAPTPSLDTILRARLISALLMIAARHAVMIDMDDDTVLLAWREAIEAEKKRIRDEQ